MSSIVNKIKEAVHSDKHHSSTAEGNHGPHSSKAANAADPRVDSDRDGSHTVGGNTNTTFGTTGAHSHSEGNHGPHNSKLANTADPRVDSDRDGSHTVGGNAYGSAGTTGSTGFGSGPASNTAGPHNSDALNKLDPRIDSDRDGSKTVGGNTNTNTGYGTSGSGFGTSTHSEGVHGQHNSRALNAADPRIDSDRDGSHTLGSGNQNTAFGSSHDAGHHTTRGHVGAAFAGTHGTGPAANTAGPHNSDALNKVDPRVDSDLDGSRTVGGNQTYSQS